MITENKKIKGFPIRHNWV